jgi:hypothetical protein
MCNCGNPAARECTRRRCGNCCSGCPRHGGGGHGGGGYGGNAGPAAAAVSAPIDPRCGDDYRAAPPPMPTDPPPEMALISPLWEGISTRDGEGGASREAWRHRVTGQLVYEKPAPMLYPVVRFVGKNGQPGRIKLIRPEPFEVRAHQRVQCMRACALLQDRHGRELAFSRACVRLLVPP